MAPACHMLLLGLVVANAAALQAQSDKDSSVSISSSGSLVRRSDPTGASACPTGFDEEYVIEMEGGHGGPGTTQGNWCEETCADKTAAAGSKSAGAVHGSCPSQSYTSRKTGPGQAYTQVAVNVFLQAPVAVAGACPASTTPYALVKGHDCQQMCIDTGDAEKRAFIAARTGVSQKTCLSEGYNKYVKTLNTTIYAKP